MNIENFDIMFIANPVSSLSHICGYTTGTKWGLEHEHVALNELSKHLHMPFRRSGLIIHPEHPFLGASSPDALFKEAAIAEIKCPYSIKDMSPHEAYRVKEANVFAREKWFS
ncbi:hypothetical protein PR048_009356 [Dryococelus australis]|uniref:YqaJ viral recombinase domain-containing protein n=1 Tax=Dryococelus australis TaxID=614101 RepID=A0ABQ9I0D7_9NEOP|nr:hypothetical protein PR048_009356 [Dryococelus australis]